MEHAESIFMRDRTVPVARICLSTDGKESLLHGTIIVVSIIVTAVRTFEKSVFFGPA
jgi:hypothetical protein